MFEGGNNAISRNEINCKNRTDGTVASPAQRDISKLNIKRLYDPIYSMYKRYMSSKQFLSKPFILMARGRNYPARQLSLSA